MSTNPEQDPAHAHEDTLVGYVERALEMQAAGETIDLHRLCNDRPEMVDAVGEILGMSTAVDRWRRLAGTRDRLLGEQLAGRYRLLARIGFGSMGTVYRAHDAELKRDVAVKVLQPALRDDAARARFEREAEALAALRHPHVVPVHDRGSSGDGVLFLVMELLEGAPLSAILAMHGGRPGARPGTRPYADASWMATSVLRHGLPERSFLRLCAHWAADLASGLQAAHDVGLVHRDVKPSNVFVTTQGRALLLDFGIATRRWGEVGDGSTMGTPWYSAPEQDTVTAQVDARCDVYSLGATLYHALGARPPYVGDPRAVAAQRRRTDPPPIQILHPGLPRDLAAIVERAMRRSPRERYASAAELEADLRAFLEHRPVRARPLSAPARIWRRARRSREVRTAAAIGLLGLLAGGAVLWRNEQEHARVRRYHELRATLPPAAGLEGPPEDRRLRDPKERAALRELLDRLLALAPTDVLTRMVRASMRLDHGDPSGAARDLEALAGAYDTPFLREVAARYGALPPTASGHPALRLDGLPPPRSAEDRLVAAFHAVRSRTRAGYTTADDLLAEPADAGDLRARDLRLLVRQTLVSLRRGREERLAGYREVHQEALLLEGAYGMPTARTRFVVGTTLVGQQRYAEAVEPLRRCLELCPWAHGARLNLAIACRRLSRLQEAENLLEEAARVRPHAWRGLVTLAQVQTERGRFPQALATAQRIPAEGTHGEAAHRLRLEGSIHLEWAFAHVRSGDEDRARDEARQAIDRFEQAATTGADPERMRLSIAMGRAILAGDLGAVLTDFLADLERDPTNPRQLENLANLLPDDLDARQIDALRSYFAALAAHLSSQTTPPVPRRRR